MDSLRDQIYELLKKGPMTDEALQHALNAPRPSVRRARQELVKKGLVEKTSGGKVGGLWGVATQKAADNERPTVKPASNKGTEGRPAPTAPPPSRPSGSYTF